MQIVNCIQCGQGKSVIPARVETFKFCSIKCRSEWRKTGFKGEGNPKWQGGIRTKRCQHCDKEYSVQAGRAYSLFKKSKFCGKACSDAGGYRATGENHARWQGGRKKRSAGYRPWVNAVLARDGLKCTRCQAEGVELHAHHIKPWKDYPELRLDVSNGVTLCARCHWTEHSASNENGVKSGEVRPGGAEDNPEPSQKGNFLEGVTTRGRAYRRWSGLCETCGVFITKRASDVKAHNFCGRSCASKYRIAQRYGSSTVVMPPRAP